MNFPSHLRAPRYCSLTHQPMFEGWCVADGAMYIKCMDDANAHAVDAGYANLEEAYEDDYMYFTDWLEIPEDEWDDIPAETVINSLVGDATSLLTYVKDEGVKHMYEIIISEYEQPTIK